MRQNARADSILPVKKPDTKIYFSKAIQRDHQRNWFGNGDYKSMPTGRRHHFVMLNAHTLRETSE